MDFVVRVNVMGAIVRDAPPSGPLGGGGSWNYVKVLEEGEKGWRGGATETTSSNVGNMKGGRELTLEDWVRKFCADGGSVKSYVIFLSFPYLPYPS